MGLQFHLNLRKARSTNRSSKMKAFVATVAMAAATSAAPEAMHHHNLMMPMVYGNVHSQGMVHHSNGAVVPDDTYAVKAAKVDHLTAKAQAYLNKPLVMAAQPVVQTVAAHTVASPMYTGYSGLYQPFGYNTHLIKREAEAEADPQLMLNTPYTAYNGVHNMAYNGVYNRLYNYAKPAVTYTAATTPVVAKGVVSPFYSGLYNYGVYGTNAHMIAKREAEAEPQMILNTPYTTINGAYNGVYNYAKSVVTPFYSGLYNYGVYGTNAHIIAKREAEAEPQFMIQAPYTTHPINYQQPIYGYNMASMAGYNMMTTPLNMYNTHLIKRGAEADPAVFYNYGMNAYTGAGLYNQMHYNPITTVGHSQIIPSAVSYNTPYAWY